MNEMVRDLARLTNVKFTMLFVRCIATATRTGLFSLGYCCASGLTTPWNRYFIDDKGLPLVPYCLNIA